MPKGSSKHKLAFKGATIMVKYHIADIDNLLNDASRFGIGMDEWIRRFASVHEDVTNYPPHNLVKESSVEFRLELALAGYSSDDIKVSTEWNKLFVECSKPEEDEPEYLHRGIAKRSFTWSRTLSDDVEVTDVSFDNGMLTIRLRRVIPDHQKKKTYELNSAG
jgi:molecular chaperone IbpA